MKITIDNVDLLELSDIQKKVMCNDIRSDVFEEDMKRRIQWILQHKYEQCLERLRMEWTPLLKANGIAMIPTDNEAFAQLVFEQPNYKCRRTRDDEAASK